MEIRFQRIIPEEGRKEGIKLKLTPMEGMEEMERGE
jgi:hypothetical protein